jgi:hypothetical protein
MLDEPAGGLADGLARGGEIAEGAPDERAVNSSESPAASTVTLPATGAVIGGAVPDVVSVSGPLCGMAAAGDVKCRQIAVPALVPSVSWVVSPAVSVTLAAFSWVRSATAAGGRVTVILVPVGLIG